MGEENLEASVGESWQRLHYFVSTNEFLETTACYRMHRCSVQEFISINYRRMKNEKLRKC
jgi:hypothetical protein